MRKIDRSDVRDLIEYEKVREAFRQRVIDLKKRRRVSVGPYLTFVFENRDTVLFQIEEMVRAERLVHEKDIVHEIEVYNALIPGPNELSATMLIEITDRRRIQPVLDRFMGIDEGRKVALRFGPERVYGEFEPGHSEADKISAVHFVRFPFSAEQSRRFRSGEDAAYLVMEHEGYRRRAALPEEVRRSLTQDLEA